MVHFTLFVTFSDLFPDVDPFATLIIFCSSEIEPSLALE